MKKKSDPPVELQYKRKAQAAPDPNDHQPVGQPREPFVLAGDPWIQFVVRALQGHLKIYRYKSDISIISSMNTHGAASAVLLLPPNFFLQRICMVTDRKWALNFRILALQITGELKYCKKGGMISG